MTIDPAWEGAVQFYELVYGTWLAYIFLIFLWGKMLRQPLAEWQYVLASFFGAGAFWVNHYFQYAEFWSTLLNIYTLVFLAAWYLCFVRPQGRGWGWQVLAMLGAVLYTIAFIAFENIARYGVDTLGYSEFWFMLTSYIAFIAIIFWRRPKSGTTDSA
jgi:hypothetical protein